MARTIDADVFRTSDPLARAVRIALVFYLSPVILAVFAVGFIAMAVLHLATMMAAVLPNAHGVAAESPIAVVAGIVGNGIKPSPLS